MQTTNGTHNCAGRHGSKLLGFFAISNELCNCAKAEFEDKISAVSSAKVATVEKASNRNQTD